MPNEKLIEIKKIKKIITKKFFNFSFILLFFVFIGTFFEMMGIGALFPLLNYLSNGNIDFFNNLNLIFNLNIEINNKSYLINFFAILLLVIYFTKSLYLTFLAYMFATFIKKIKINLTIRLFKKYLSINYLSMIQKNTNIAINTINKEVDELASSYIIPLIILVNEIIVATGVLLIIFYLYPSSSIVLISILFSVGVIFLIISKKYNTIWGVERLKNSELLLKNVNQSLNAFKEIRLLGIQNIFLNIISINAKGKIIPETKQSILDQLPRFWLEFICLISIMIYAFFFIRPNNQYNDIIPILGIFAIAGFRILPSLNRIVNTIQIIRYGKASINKIYNELIFLEKNHEVLTKDLFKDNFSKLSMKNISFSYQNDSNYILNKVNLEISKNEFIGIVGESGSGKTTLVNLIAGLIKSKHGSILINNIEINKINTDWQKKIGYVPQKIYILDDSIKNNIAFEVDQNKISNEKVKQAIKLATLDKFVDQLPDNINSQIGENGNSLSGGQIQRIGIARALYKNPEILILDEPTSSLDEKTEAEFIQILNRIKSKYTIIIISHRSNSIKYCDKIFEIKNGKIEKIDLIDFNE